MFEKNGGLTRARFPVAPWTRRRRGPPALGGSSRLHVRNVRAFRHLTVATPQGGGRGVARAAAGRNSDGRSQGRAVGARHGGSPEPSPGLGLLGTRYSCTDGARLLHGWGKAPARMGQGSCTDGARLGKLLKPNQQEQLIPALTSILAVRLRFYARGQPPHQP
jgi:hypothetical protein